MAFNRRGNQRGGGGRRPPLEYVFTGTTYREVNGEKVEDANEEWQLAITIPTVTKKGNRPLEELIAKLTEIADTNGDLGARLVMYVSPRSNDQTGEEFAATNILVQPKLPAKPQGGGRGGFQRQQSNGGRRSYPPQRTNNRPQREEEPEEELDDSVEEDTPPPPVKKAPVKAGGVKSGQAAPKPASPSKKAAPPVEEPPAEEDYDEDNVPL